MCITYDELLETIDIYIYNYISQDESKQGVYKKWCSYNFNPKRTGYVAMEDVVNGIVTSEDDKATAREVYNKCMKCEAALFQAMWMFIVTSVRDY